MKRVLSVFEEWGCKETGCVWEKYKAKNPRS